MYGRRSQLAEFADLSNMVFRCCLCVIDVKLVSSFFCGAYLGARCAHDAKAGWRIAGFERLTLSVSV